MISVQQVRALEYMYKLAEDHGLDVRVDSSRSVGETFVIVPRVTEYPLYTEDAKLVYLASVEEVTAWILGWGAAQFYDDQVHKDAASKGVNNPRVSKKGKK